jgi:KRAB domain-containing zinc finger protein
MAEQTSRNFKQTRSDEDIINNIKKEREVEFLLILPPALLKIEKEENEVQEQNIEKFQCEKCPKSFETPKKLHFHRKVHEPKVKCQICGKEVKKHCLRNHLKRHKTIKDYNCDHCASAFVIKSHLIRHMWAHRSDKQFSCSHCHLSFNVDKTFEFHLLSHTKNPRPFQCDLCDKNFTGKKNLARHLMSVHSNSNEHVFKCDKCNFTSKRKDSLKAHDELVHVKARPFPCPICKKTFKRASNVQRHQSVHKSVRDFKCTDCGTLFKTERHLKQHVRSIHSKSLNSQKKCQFKSLISFSVITERFNCNKCSTTFRTKANLKAHEMRHLNEGTSKCSVCLKEFKKKYLNNHYSRTKCGKTLNYTKKVR